LAQTGFFFIDELFEITTPNVEGEFDCSMDAEQILKLSAGILSIVLSHQFKKQLILRMVEGMDVDFMVVRDAMYKYSKKTEEGFFQTPCMAFLFIHFARSEVGK
jgi:hypothetical protein